MDWADFVTASESAGRALFCLRRRGQLGVRSLVGVWGGRLAFVVRWGARSLGGRAGRSARFR